MENIGAIITAYRKKAHISQTELVDRLQAEGIEVSQKSVSAWETGRNEVSARIFLHICRILEIPDCLEEYFGSNPKDPLSMLIWRSRTAWRNTSEATQRTPCPC